MNFESLEIYAKEAKEARSRNQDDLAKNLDEKIMTFIVEQDFLFPVIEESLINQNNASFLYKNNKTYPNLLEFIAKILHSDIPVVVDTCKFGPGGINLVAENAEQAHHTLIDCTRELQRLIQAKGRK
jgi:hypothetical protein